MKTINLFKIIILVISAIPYIVYKINEPAIVGANSLIYDAIYGGGFLVIFGLVARSWLKKN